jgi:sugar phosphate isomerase/epimerase
VALLDIRIGTLVGGGGPDPAGYIRQIIPHGFESFQITFSPDVVDTDLVRLANEIKAEIAGKDIVIGALGMYGNPLVESSDGEKAIAAWEKVIDHAELFGTDVIGGFTGRVPGKPIEESLGRFRKVFGELTRRAADKGAKIAFENCSMGGTWQTGDWNIAHNPAAWELMFNEVPADNIGLEWEPCHQMVTLIDPIPHIRQWGPRIFHIHGKDATIRWDVVKEHGVAGKEEFAFHRTPGFGDSDWTRIITDLRLVGFKGSIDIEGWHDPIYRDELEMTGQVHGLNYLKGCRGGASYVENPKVAERAQA